jgi:ActR/RegA family two-component response regulator
MLLWIIDDTPLHHDTVAVTAALVPGVRVAGFASAEEGIAAYRAAVQDVRKIPDAVLMDFYLGDDRGDRVTAKLRRLENHDKRPVIIGYSSVASGSAAILAAGADLSLKKQRNDDGGNPALLEWLRRAVGAAP